ncbi:MAG: A/G-specific adenine glycosylase [Bacteroidales bacterium]|nr:A/G-specific adenine glycosylase [Bacteroidales bacterium]
MGRLKKLSTFNFQFSTASSFPRFSEELLRWYAENRRDLPWRNTNDPYKIWVSEIILQQTRVMQGMDYYFRFLQRFPTVKSLAEAPQEDVLKIWQGLGYYSRARNMQEAAQTIMRVHNGQFPSNMVELRQLKGIGEYTASAIASFAYQQPYPAVDGNVFRIICRFFGIFENIALSSTKKIITQKASELISHDHPDDFNQAMMDFGSLQCTPKSPKCENCPLANECFAFQNDKVDALPVVIKNINIKQRFFHYFFFAFNHSTYIKQRIDNDIWKGLFELPMIESDSKNIDFELVKSTFGLSESITEKHLFWEVKHQLSHQTIFADFFVISLDTKPKKMKEYKQVSISQLTTFPMMKIMAEFIDKLLKNTIFATKKKDKE